MGKATIYLNKEAEEVYRVAKEYAGDNLSAVIVQSLKLYVDKMDSTTKGMKEVIIFEGTRDVAEDISCGKNLRFIGLKLVDACKQDNYRQDVSHDYSLYLTRKGKFLVVRRTINSAEVTEASSHKVYNSFAEVTAAGYPIKMIEEARKKIPEIACEELDV